MVELNFKEEINFPVSFSYKGVWCSELFIKLDDNMLGGWVEIYNNWGEKMFSGNTKDGLVYAGKLLQGEFS